MLNILASGIIAHVQVFVSRATRLILIFPLMQELSLLGIYIYSLMLLKFKFFDTHRYTSAVIAYNWKDSSYSHFGDRDGQMWLDDMRCTGSETRIEDCPHAGWGNNNCIHNLPFSEQAGVMCFNPGKIIFLTRDF